MLSIHEIISHGIIELISNDDFFRFENRFEQIGDALCFF